MSDDLDRGDSNRGDSQRSEASLQEAELNKQLVRDMLAALVKNRVGLMHDHWWEDMVWIGPPGIGTMRGLHQFEYDLRASFLHSFPDKQLGESILLAEGEWVAAQGYFHATFARDWLGIPATGRSTRIRYTDFWRVEVRGGIRELAENRVTIDILHVLEQSGYDMGQVLRYLGARPPESFSE
ncbi:MAG: nuclear transport factor 2 family protein [Chloroflexi bacterium]|nr:nuclear transport factor 2 family protein [Chloroflexota bacterium]